MIVSDLIYPLITLAIGVVIWQHINMSSRAYKLALNHTQKHNVMLLDQSVFLKKIRVVRSKFSIIAIERQYAFEFSSVGDARYQGIVIFHGPRLEHISLQPYKTNALHDEETEN